MKFTTTIKLGGMAALLAGGMFMAGAASAATPPGGGGDSCRVSEDRGSGARFFVPTGGSGNYNILGWGNGTGGTVSVYSGLLESIAEQCILVAAATTSNSGNGRDVESAVNQAKSRYANIVGSDPKVCTSGHSQGGGGAFNAANRLGADCVIAVQPDTVFTTRIDRPVASNVDVVCIFSTGDVLAPALPSNGRNCRNNSTRYTQETTSGTHFAPIGGTGGAPGRVAREYAARWLVNN